MARSALHSTMEQLNSLVECAICTETYKDPRILPCVHTYCLKCIRGLCKDIHPKDKATCPLCRTEFTIPASGVDGLTKNFLLEQLKDIARGSSVHCEGCTLDEDEAAEQKLATMFCVACSQRFCESCVEIHRRVRATRTHKLVKMEGDEVDEEFLSKLALTYCEKHQDEALKYYCFDCQVPICATCFVVLHNTHKCSDINEVADEFRNSLRLDIEHLAGAVPKCRQIIAERNKEKEEFIQSLRSVERAIYMRAERLIKQIEQEKQQLLKEVQVCQNDRVKEIDHVKGEVEQHLSFIESLREYAKELAFKGTAAAITQQISSVQDRRAELLKFDCVQRLVDDLGSMHVTFKEAWSTVNVVGSLTASRTKAAAGTSILSQPLVQSNALQRHLKTTPPSDSKSSSPTLTHTIPGSKYIESLTSMNNELFVLRAPHRGQIEVYSTSTFQLLQRTLSVPFLSTGFCRLASCETNNCIYVSDWKEDTVHKVDVASDSKPVKWRVGHRPDGLSVNRACNVLVTCVDDNTIEEYTPRGSAVRKVRLQPSQVNKPFHAAELSNGHYAVSHREPVHGVSVVDREGQVVFTYRNDPESATQLLNEPRYLAVDGTDCTLVADSKNNRILLLDSSLSCARDLPLQPNDGLKGPWCLHLDESRDRLYVGESSGRRVLVFDNLVNYSMSLID